MEMYKKYTGLMRMTFLEKLAYAKAAWFDIAGTMVSILIYYFLWKYVFMERNELNGYTMAQMTTYVILSRMLSSQFSGGINIPFAEWIYDGGIGMELLRPVTLFFTLSAKRLGEFLFFVLFKGLPVMIVSILILRGTGPAGGTEVLLFCVSTLLSLIIMFYIEFMVGIGSFYTLNSYGLRFTKAAVLSVLSGGIVPLFLFPKMLAQVLDLLPFAGMVSVPVQIFLGKYTYGQTTFYLLMQCAWAMIMGVFAHLLYHLAIRKVIVQGG